MQNPRIVILATTVVLVGVGGFIFSATRHTSACRGSYTYDAAGGKCGSPIASTTTSDVPSKGGTREPVLGRSWSPYQHGYGSIRPGRIDNGGDPTGVVANVRWQSWGKDRAVGSGISTYLTGSQIVADGTQQRATVVAFNLGTCRGVPAYTAIEWYFPQHGDRFDPNNYINICTGQYVGSP